MRVRAAKVPWCHTSRYPKSPFSFHKRAKSIHSGLVSLDLTDVSLDLSLFVQFIISKLF